MFFYIYCCFTFAGVHTRWILIIYFCENVQIQSKKNICVKNSLMQLFRWSLISKKKISFKDFFSVYENRWYTQHLTRHKFSRLRHYIVVCRPKLKTCKILISQQFNNCRVCDYLNLRGCLVYKRTVFINV